MYNIERDTRRDAQGPPMATTQTLNKEICRGGVISTLEIECALTEPYQKKISHFLFWIWSGRRSRPICWRLILQKLCPTRTTPIRVHFTCSEGFPSVGDTGCTGQVKLNDRLTYPTFQELQTEMASQEDKEPKDWGFSKELK